MKNPPLVWLLALALLAGSSAFAQPDPLTVYPSGNVGIGTAEEPEEQLKVEGDLTASGDLTVGGEASVSVMTVTGDLHVAGTLSAGMGLTAPMLHVQDQKPAGTQGGGITGNRWNARTLNTVITNTISGAALANNQITLPPGVYDVDASAPGFRINYHHASLYSVTDDQYLVYGTTALSSQSDAGGNWRSWVRGRINLVATTVLELRHYANSTRATTGAGVCTNLGIVEIYSDVIIRRVGY